MNLLLSDRIRPKNLADFTYNHDVIKKLKNLTKSNEISHMIIQGSAGSGKKSLALAFLNQKFGNQVFNLKRQTIELSYPNKQISLNLVHSLYHYQINPALYGVYDRLIVQDFLKNLVKFNTVHHSIVPYRTIIIEEADKLSSEAQQSLRRTLECYINSFRCIFITRNLGSLIPAIQSRCVILRVSAPNSEQLRDILKSATQRQLPESLIKSIIKQSGLDLSTALNMLERTLLIAGDKNLPNKIKLSELSEVDQEIDKILKCIFSSNDLNIIEKIREILYKLLIHGLTPEEIIKKIFLSVIKQIKDEHKATQNQIIQTTVTHELNLNFNSKPIYHLESYCVDLLKIVKNWMIKK